MKIVNSEIFGKIMQPRSFDDLFKAITAGIDDGFITRMWRGQGDVNWPVHSSAYRRITYQYEGGLQDYETSLLSHATHRGYRFVDGRELSDLELLARLQHHGAATRLLDTSRNALVGLWFCCVSEPEKSGALIGIHTNHLGGYEGEPETRPYKDVMADLTDMDYPMTWEPPSITGRVAAQHSQFIFSEMKSEKWGSVALPKEEGATSIYSITPELKVRCLRILQEVFDIRLLSLFPDLEGFGQANSHNRDQFYNNRW